MCIPNLCESVRLLIATNDPSTGRASSQNLLEYRENGSPGARATPQASPAVSQIATCPLPLPLLRQPISECYDQRVGVALAVGLRNSRSVVECGSPLPLWNLRA